MNNTALRASDIDSSEYSTALTINAYVNNYALPNPEQQGEASATLISRQPEDLLPVEARNNIAEHYKHSWQRQFISAEQVIDLHHRPTIANPSFIAEQEWEGEVAEINGENFTARLHDVTNRQPLGVYEEAEFSLQEVSEYELPLLREGAIFRWSLGFQRSASGTKMRTARLVFRRLPAWSRKEIEDCKTEAESIFKNIEWDDE